MKKYYKTYIEFCSVFEVLYLFALFKDYSILLALSHLFCIFVLQNYIFVLVNIVRDRLLCLFYLRLELRI